MLLYLGLALFVAAVVALVVAIGLSLSALRQIKQLRRELDETQHMVNELTAAATMIAAPPIPRARSAGLDDLRQQLRQAHREESDAPSP